MHLKKMNQLPHTHHKHKILRPNCKMKLSIVALVATAEAGTASSNWSNVRRHLSFEKVAGYEPGSQVCTPDCSVAFISVAVSKSIRINKLLHVFATYHNTKRQSN